MNCCNDNGECTRGHGCPCGPECTVIAVRNSGACGDFFPEITAVDWAAIAAIAVTCCAILGGSFGFFYSIFKT